MEGGQCRCVNGIEMERNNGVPSEGAKRSVCDDAIRTSASQELRTLCMCKLFFGAG